MRVFALQQTNHDISDASRFGKIVYVFGERRPSLFDHEGFRSQYLDRMEELRFDPNKDFVVFVGTAIPSVLCTSFLMEEYGGFNALLFNATTQQYLLRRIGDEAS